ncbi:MAG: IS1380 family transposase, partial [Methylococcales bacterium]
MRGDSGYFVGALLDLPDASGHGYLIEVKLKNLAQLMGKPVWQPIKGQPGWEQCEFHYAGYGWA